jgi:hypothetical protein
MVQTETVPAWAVPFFSLFIPLFVIVLLFQIFARRSTAFKESLVRYVHDVLYSRRLFLVWYGSGIDGYIEMFLEFSWRML